MGYDDRLDDAARFYIGESLPDFLQPIAPRYKG